MDQDQFLVQHFDTLREEIKAIKTRSFWIVAMGLFGVPIVTRYSEGSERYVTLLIPYVVLVLIVMFLAEQNALMRAGRYIRQKIEPKIVDFDGWESWLESRADLRLMDRHLFAVFTLVFFLYYFMTVGLALQTLLTAGAEDSTERWWAIGASVTYAIGAVWALSTLIHHWRSCVGTSDDMK